MMNQNILLIEKYLDSLYLDPICELDYKNEYQLVIMVMLSAMTTDKLVNKVSKELFSKYKDLNELKNASVLDIENIIRPLGNQSRKSFNIKEIATILIDKYNGNVPSNRKDLESLPGIGRKCCNVILGELFNIQEFAVDTHVIRVSNRLGLSNSLNPLEVEKDLIKIFKENERVKRHKQMVLFGRYHCQAKKPNCLGCKLQNICNYYKEEICQIKK